MLQPGLGASEIVEAMAKLRIKEKGEFHYYRDSNGFTPMYKPKLPEKMPEYSYFSIVFNSINTNCINQTSEDIYKKNGLRYFRLMRNSEGNYILARNTDGLLSVPDGRYEYVITDDQNVCEMRIGKMPHYYLNAKRYNHVVLAGEIIFQAIGNAANLVEINDKSGGYHFADEDLAVFCLKLDSIRHAIEAVGLPFEKFKYTAQYRFKEAIDQIQKLSKEESIKYIKALASSENVQKAHLHRIRSF
jgi:hypothetical protein